MGNFNPDNAEPVVGKFNPDNAEPVSTGEPTPTWQSFLRGMINGSTLGIGTRAGAAIRSAVPYHLEPGANGPTIAHDAPGEGTYNQLLAEEQAANTKAANDHPVANIAGNVLGGIPQGLGVARTAMAAGPGIFRPILAGGAAGAGQGAIQGAAQTPDLTNLPQAAKDTAMGASVGGAAGVVGTGLTKVIPVIKNAVAAPGMAATADALKGTAPSAGIGVLDRLSLPGLGALGGMGSKALGIGQPKASWETDTPSAIADVAKSGLQGAALGAAAKYGIKAGAAALDAAGNTALGAAKKVGSDADKVFAAATSDASNTGSDPFGKLGKWFSPGLESDNPQVQQVAQKVASVADPLDDTTSRQTAMALETTPEGRAVSNDTSPLHDTDTSSGSTPLEAMMDKNAGVTTPSTIAGTTISPQGQLDAMASDLKNLSIKDRFNMTKMDALAQKNGFDDYTDYTKQNQGL